MCIWMPSIRLCYASSRCYLFGVQSTTDLKRVLLWWVLNPPGFQLSLHLHRNKSEVSPTVYQSKFNEFFSQYDVYTRIFTDGSKSGEAVGSAAIVASRLCKKRLPNNSSIVSASIMSSANSIPWNTIGTRHDTPVYRQSAPVSFWLFRDCIVFKIETSHTLLLQRFFVVCMV